MRVSCVRNEKSCHSALRSKYWKFPSTERRASSEKEYEPIP